MLLGGSIRERSWLVPTLSQSGPPGIRARHGPEDSVVASVLGTDALHPRLRARCSHVVLTALLAPRVAYRSRDALMLLFPPAGIRLAWVIGTRLGQLPHRDWPARTDGIPLQGRQAARIAAAVNRYRSRRQRQVKQTGTLPQNGRATCDSEQRSPAVTPVSTGPSLTDYQD